MIVEFTGFLTDVDSVLFIICITFLDKLFLKFKIFVRFSFICIFYLIAQLAVLVDAVFNLLHHFLSLRSVTIFLLYDLFKQFLV